MQHGRLVQLLGARNQQPVVVIGLLLNKLLRTAQACRLINDLRGLETLEASIVNLDFLDEAWLQELRVCCRSNYLGLVHRRCLL